MRILLCCAIATVLAAAMPAAAAPESSRALAIIAPSEKGTQFDEDGAVVVSLAAAPPLADGEFIVVRVDQQVVVIPDGVTGFALTGVPEGAHLIVAMIVDAEGKPLSVARPLTFHVGAGSRI
jgi:hypothetical protein